MERKLEKKQAFHQMLNAGGQKLAAHRHFLLLLFWPLFLFAFYLLENTATGRQYHVIRCPLDTLVPFCGVFVIPYVMWFVFVGGMTAYTALCDKAAFVRYMKFIILTYTAALIAFLVYPSTQPLRPEFFANPDIFTRMVVDIYSLDTNTNVCPSVHVLGQVAVLLAALDCKRLSSLAWRLFFILSSLAVCLSTVFIKQHSVLDVIAALVLCAIAAPLVYRRKGAPAGKERSR